VWWTYISKEINEISIAMATRIPFTTKDLENENTKAEYIGFDWEEALASILRRHVATNMIDIVFVKLLYMI
jgi:hypothetical protein